MALVPFSPSRSPRKSQQPLISEGLFANINILEHLDNFRKRIVRSLIAVCIGVLIGFAAINPVFDFVMGPTRRALPPGSKLIYTQPGEAFSLYIQIALIIGIIIAMPYVMYQLWRLIGPLMPKSTRKFAIPFVLFTTLGFVAGAAFTHYIAFPYMMGFFASFNTPDLQFLPKLEDVFDLYSKMMLGMGAVFQMPTVVFFLAKAGLVSARFLWRSFRYAFLIIFIVAAVITPTGDMVTQTIFAAPMVGLYILSIIIAWIFGKARIVEAPPEEP